MRAAYCLLLLTLVSVGFIYVVLFGLRIWIDQQ
jgi:hypothetical protein